MKRIIKVFIVSVLSLNMVLSICGTAFAGTLETNQFVTIEAYEDAMSEIYAKYGMEWKIIDSYGITQITKASYDSEIARATKECEDYQTAFNKSNSEVIQIKSTQEANRDVVIRGMMPVTKNVYASTKVEFSFWASCFIEAFANYTFNANAIGNTPLSLNSWMIYSAAGVNLDEWVDTGSEVVLTDTGCYANFRGTCYFSHTIPVINIKVSQTVPVIAGVSMK